MTARVSALEGNTQRLDGGAMYGNAPRAVWSRWSPPDEQNRIALACRSLFVVEDGGRKILCEAGIGAFFSPAMRERYGVVEDRHVLLDSLAAVGLTDADIDVVVLSHLHFDHAGGLLSSYTAGSPSRLLFPRATFVLHRDAWARARAPHPRDRASFIPELNDLLETSGRLELIDESGSPTLGPAYRFHVSYGHTPGLLLIELTADGGPVVFAGDLVPGRPWVHLPLTMGYDRYPELLIDEKTRLIEDLYARGGRLFFTHDPDCAFARIVRDERGRFGAA